MNILHLFYSFCARYYLFTPTHEFSSRTGHSLDIRRRHRRCDTGAVRAVLEAVLGRVRRALQQHAHARADGNVACGHVKHVVHQVVEQVAYHARRVVVVGLATIGASIVRAREEGSGGGGGGGGRREWRRGRCR